MPLERFQAGKTLSVKYKAASGLTTVAIDVYDPKHNQVIVKGVMTDIGTTGVYD